MSKYCLNLVQDSHTDIVNFNSHTDIVNFNQYQRITQRPICTQKLPDACSMIDNSPLIAL